MFIPTLSKKSVSRAGKRIADRFIKESKDPLSCIRAFCVLLFLPLAIWGIAAGTIRINTVLGVSVPAASQGQKTFVEPSNYQPESPDLTLIQRNTLVAMAPPVTVTPQVLGSILGEPTTETNKEIKEYQVVPGDTLSEIAEKFGISLNTLLWANSLSNNSTIKIGESLVIPPVDGVVYHVKQGDTLSAIAKTYKASAQDIISFNELSSADDIFIGDILMIPGGTMPASSVSSPNLAQVPIASSYFICPITSPCYITQSLHFYNAVDFSHGKCGDAVLAAAGGVVEAIKYGWNGGAGNTIYILHPNGVATSYGHILAATVSIGDHVYQGQQIALMGGDQATQGVGAGISTGCHVHFAVHGGVNPFGTLGTGYVNVP